MATVRSAARARNRPRRTLAWLFLVAVSAVAALAARAAAAPRGASALDGEAAAAAGTLDDAVAPDGAGAPDGADPHAIDPEDTEDAERAEDAEVRGGVPRRELDGALEGALESALEGALAAADAAEPAGGRARRPRPPRWGRLELTVLWRRTLDEAPAEDPSRRGALWLLATWSR